MRRSLLLIVLFASIPVRAQTAVDRDFEAFVAHELRMHRVPGASIAVIREHRVAWTKAFGVTRSLTREPATTDTVFPVASNGKPVAAWLAMLLASRGAIDLDKPVVQQATIALDSRITPRHLLTHTSGLGNFLRDRRRALRFEPGARFDYSGVGFMVLQELLEQRSGQTLDQLAERNLFQPLGMQPAWFGARPVLPPRLAAPHVELVNALAPFTLVFAPIASALLVMILIAQRLRRGTWALGWRTIAVVCGVSIAGAFAFLLSKSGSWVLTAWFVFVPVSLIAVVAAALRIVRSQRAAQAAIVVAVLALIVVFREAPLPLPAGETGPANAASSLRASAPALANFMIELARPRLLDPIAAADMTSAHVRIDDVAAWGLGVGVERHARGRDLWHWGSNPGAKSIMILCPETGDGVVVLTNGSNGSVPMRNIARRVMRRNGCWQAGCNG